MMRLLVKNDFFPRHSLTLFLLLISVGVAAEENSFVKRKAYLEKLKSASVLDEGMFDLYRMPVDILAERPLNIPLLFPWSDPVFRHSMHEKNKITLHRVSSRYMARNAIYNYAGTLSNQMERYFSYFPKGSLDLNVCVYSNRNNYGYAFSVSNKLVHTKEVVVDQWESLPGYGSWVAQSPDGRKWSGIIQYDHPTAFAAAAFVERFRENKGVNKPDASLLDEVIRTIRRETKGEMILGIRIQTDGQPGVFLGGYLINGKRSGLWCYTTSTGSLQFEYLVEDAPVCARVTTHLQRPLNYRVDKIHDIFQENTNSTHLAGMKFITYNTPFGYIGISLRNGKLATLGGLEREGAAIIHINWDESGKPEACIQAAEVDPVCGLFFLFQNISDGDCTYFFNEVEILLNAMGL